MTITIPSSGAKTAHMADSYQLIEEHILYMRAIGLAQDTIDAARYVLTRVQQEFPAGLWHATPQELTGWLATPGWSVQTRATYRSHLVRAYHWAVHGPNPCLTWDPSAGIPKPRIPRGLPHPATDDQVRRAVTELDMPWRMHVRLAAYCGMRRAEIARLDRKDCTDQVVRVHGKGGKVREVPMRDEVWEIVRRMPSGPLTTNPGEGRAKVTPKWVGSTVRRKLKAIGLNLTLHEFRHWYATTLLATGADLREVQEMMGHESVATTQTYTAVSSARMRTAASRLPSLTS